MRYYNLKGCNKGFGSLCRTSSSLFTKYSAFEELERAGKTPRENPRSP